MLVERFVEHLTYEKRFSAHTVDAYRRDLDQFVQFLGEFGIKEPEQATDRVIRAWMMRLMENKVGARSVNRKLSSLRSFFRFARIAGTITTEPTTLIDPPKTPQRLPEFVEEKRMDRLFDEIKWPDGFTGLTHRLILEMLYGTGMRLAELLGLHVGDVDLKAGNVRVLGKRNKERILPVGDELRTNIHSYLHERFKLFGDRPTMDMLLVDKNGEPMARRSVQRLVTHYLSGVTSQKKRSPHVLRHTFATHMLEHGADLNAVKELLGHANLAATQVYTHNTVEKLRKVHAQAHPRGGA